MIDTNQYDNYIAIIGMACRFPGSRNISEYWTNLVQGIESIRFFSDEELEKAGIPAETFQQPDYVKAKGVLENSEYFDANFFDLTPREAEVIDPQHRVFLECAWHALEDGGYDPENTPARIGVFGGMGITKHLFRLYHLPQVQRYAGSISIVTGNDKDYLTTRTSYKLNLKGPSIDVQSACSTSLVAVVLGIHSLLSYQSDMVLAGGVSIDTPEIQGYVYQEGGIESPDGHCRAFDAQAKGTVFSRGAGIVLLKRLSEAIRDRDNIYAVIRGGAINNDGAIKAGFSAPSVEGQVEVATEAMSMAEVTPDMITYYETHGTGTTIGDPIEIAALTRVFKSHTDKKGFCRIGSVKTNIGHTDAAAGAAGLIKTAMALKHRLIPASLHYKNPNPEIDFDNSPFIVNTKLSEWKRNGSPLLAGVSAFGVGGTNASVILEEAPALPLSPAKRSVRLFVLSAKTASALDTMSSNLLNYVKDNPELNLDDAAYTLQAGRRMFNYRRFFTCTQREDLIKALEDPAKKGVHTLCHAKSDAPVVFMFPGQGNQYINMGVDLYHNEDVFKHYLDICIHLLQTQSDIDLGPVLFPAKEDKENARYILDQTKYAQPALFSVQYALAQLLLSWGIKPGTMIGHSVGEYTAACIAGIFSLEEALLAVTTRASLVQKMDPGDMLAILKPESEVLKYLTLSVGIAAVNSPKITIVSGPTENIATLIETLKQEKIPFKKLPTSHAFHSVMMDPVLKPFGDFFKSISLNKPQIPLVSSVTGTWMTDTESCSPDYWVEQVRKPVRFSDGIDELIKTADRVFVETGPGNSLQSALKYHPRGKEHFCAGSIPVVDEDIPGHTYLINELGTLWAAGVKISWDKFHGNEQRSRISLPGYPFERKLFSTQPYTPQTSVPVDLNKNEKQTDIGTWFYTPSWQRSPSIDIFCSREENGINKEWIIFSDTGELGAEIVQSLAEKNIYATIVKTGDSFYASETNTFIINPLDKNHYELLFKDFKNKDKKPGRIIHLWNLDRPEKKFPGTKDEESVNHDSFISLLYLQQALINQGFVDGIHLTVVVNGVFDVTGDTSFKPENGLALGPCRVFRQEYPRTYCRAIDIIFPEDTQTRQTMAGYIIKETMAEVDDFIAAYRGGQRWTETFHPVFLDTPTEISHRFKKEGVYLITGGLGGMGLKTAEYLASTFQARLVLGYRSFFPPKKNWQEWLESHSQNDPVSEKITGIQAVEKAGGTVLLCQVDVTDPESVNALRKTTLKEFGTLDGIFHLAGLAGGGVISLKSEEMAREVLAPKVRGTILLDRAFQGDDPDFFIFYSSITSILGESGRVDYCSANAFLDTYASYRNKEIPGRYVSINWGRWGLVGMGARTPGLRTKSDSGQKQTESGELYYQIEKNDQEVKYQLTIDPHKDWIINEHILMGVPTLVGTAYFDILHSLSSNHYSGNTIKLEKIYFTTPYMAPPGEEKILQLWLKDEDHHKKLSFKSKTGNDNGRPAFWQEHMKAELTIIEDNESPIHDISALLQEMEEIPIQKGTIIHEESNALEFGPRWNCLTKVYGKKDSWMAVLELPGEFKDDLGVHPLHPALMDIATSYALRFISRDLYLPLSYKQTLIRSPLTPVIYAYTTLQSSSQKNTDREIVSLDIIIMDSRGKELIQINGYVLKKVPESYLQHGKNTHGMMNTPGNNKQVKQDITLDKNDILPREGIEALHRALNAPFLSQIIISQKDFLKLVKDNIPSTETKESQDTVTAGKEQTMYDRPAIATPYVEPGNEIEKSLSEIWGDVLGIKKIGVNDNFMELGGNSLLAIQAVANISETFLMDLTIDTFFQSATIAGIAEKIIEQLSSITSNENLEKILSEIE